MMSSKHVSGLLMALCLWGGAASAQDGSGYAEESVGMVDYDDEEAAGPADATEDATSAPEGGGDVVVDGTYEDIDPDTKAQLSADATVVAAAEEEEPAVSTAPVRVSDPDRAKRPQWEWGAKRHHSSWNGTTGLMDIKEAGSGPAGTFGLGLFTGFFKYSDYLVLGDENSYMAGALNLRVTPFRFLEFHAAVKAVANRNNREYPELFQTIGDMDFGVKGFFSPVDLITLGLDFGLTFMNSIGNTAMDFSGTSVGFDALATFDFAALNEKAPLRAHLMLGYLFDNSYHLIEDIEADAGGCGSDLDGDGLIEYQGCLSPVERTALGIDRNDQLHIGIGLDALLPYVSPILEYHLDIPINRQGFTCPRIPGSFDSCMSDAGGKGMRGWLNVGARILPPLADLAIDLGVEIGLSGYAPSVHELAAQEPWM